MKRVLTVMAVLVAFLGGWMLATVRSEARISPAFAPRTVPEEGESGPNPPDPPRKSAADERVAPGVRIAPGAAVAPEPEPLGAEDISPAERRNIEVFRSASASVVNITSLSLQRDFFTMDVMQIPQGTGSGFVWDDEGHIVTNYHVAQAGSRYVVTLSDGKAHSATLVGVAPDKDLAVLLVEDPPATLVALALGRSADLLVGQTVLALGNPFGLDHSLTVGIVSALGREISSPTGRQIHDVIQTDAAINPGNSGGPLLDSRGRLVGVNTAIYSPSGASAGIGFAIPVDTVRALVPEIIRFGHPIQPTIGASILADRTAARAGIEGAAIVDVQAGGPAERAGLTGLQHTRGGNARLGDVVVAVDGSPVANNDEMMTAFENAGAGKRVTLTVERDGKRRDVDVTLAAGD